MSAHATPRLSIAQARELLRLIRGEPHEPRHVEEAATQIDLALQVARLLKAARQHGYGGPQGTPLPHPREVEAWIGALLPGERIMFHNGARYVIDTDEEARG